MPVGPLLTSSVHWSAFAPLLVTALAIMGSPGPATISLTATGAAFGVRRSARYLAGIVAGTTVVLLAVAVGVTGVLLATPALRPVLIAAAVGYILYLAYHIATAPPLGAGSATAAAPSAARRPPARGREPEGVGRDRRRVRERTGGVGRRARRRIKTAALTVLIVVINTAWLAAGASLAPVLRDPARARRANVLLATALVVSTAAALVR